MGLMFRRRRPIARLAAGAATAGIAYRAGRRRAGQDQYDEQPLPLSSAPQYVAPPPASTGGEVDELGRLVQMHESGALTDQEFVAAKAHLLDI